MVEESNILSILVVISNLFYLDKFQRNSITCLILLAGYENYSNTLFMLPYLVKAKLERNIKKFLEES